MTLPEPMSPEEKRAAVRRAKVFVVGVLLVAAVFVAIAVALTLAWF